MAEPEQKGDDWDIESAADRRQLLEMLAIEEDGIAWFVKQGKPGSEIIHTAIRTFALELRRLS